MKTAISMPDALFRKADRLAKKLRVSRSAFISRAVAELVARYDDDEVRESYERLCKDVDTRPDPVMQAAVRRVLARVES